MRDGATIAAISTAVSIAGIGIVRMSGPESFFIADRVYRSKGEKKLSEQKSHTIHYGYIMDQEETVDEVLVMLMRGPRSFTGEDTVEINCHGGVYVVRKILEILIENGEGILTIGKDNAEEFNVTLNNWYLKNELQPLKDCLRKCIRTLEI